MTRHVGWNFSSVPQLAIVKEYARYSSLARDEGKGKDKMRFGNMGAKKDSKLVAATRTCPGSMVY